MRDKPGVWIHIGMLAALVSGFGVVSLGPSSAQASKENWAIATERAFPFDRDMWVGRVSDHYERRRDRAKRQRGYARSYEHKRDSSLDRLNYALRSGHFAQARAALNQAIEFERQRRYFMRAYHQNKYYRDKHRGHYDRQQDRRHRRGKN